VMISQVNDRLRIPTKHIVECDRRRRRLFRHDRGLSLPMSARHSVRCIDHAIRRRLRNGARGSLPP
jgi:hypothetical protein